MSRRDPPGRDRAPNSGSGPRVVFQVICADPRVRTSVEQCLRGAGLTLHGSGPWTPNTRLATVTEAFRLTRAEFQAVEALTRHDSIAGSAGEFFISAKAAEDRLGRAQKMLGVRSRHRLLVRAYELRILSFGSTLGPGPASGPRAVLHVTCADPHVRTSVQRRLADAGFAVRGSDRLTLSTHLAAVTETFHLTERELQAIEALTRHDTAGQIAEELSISPKAVEDRLGRAQEKLDVRSRHRLVVRAVELGILILQPVRPPLEDTQG